MIDINHTPTPDEINQLPILHFEGEILLPQNSRELEAALARLGGEPVLGFDTETRPAFRKGERYLPSLLQLAGPQVAVLVQLQRLDDLTVLWELMRNPDVSKAGVAIRDDIAPLAELGAPRLEGMVEIADYARRAGLKRTGLRNLAACLMQGRITKGAQVSNWARHDLTDRQCLYAATDAWISREIYLILRDLPAAPPSPRPEAAKKSA